MSGHLHLQTLCDASSHLSFGLVGSYGACTVALYLTDHEPCFHAFLTYHTPPVRGLSCVRSHEVMSPVVDNIKYITEQ